MGSRLAGQTLRNNNAFREHRARWLYTGLTRAAETVTVVV